MQTITINIENEQTAEKVTWLLEHFKNDGVEILSRENLDDLKLLKSTRGETTTPLNDYLNDEG